YVESRLLNRTLNRGDMRDRGRLVRQQTQKLAFGCGELHHSFLCHSMCYDCAAKGRALCTTRLWLAPAAPARLRLCFSPARATGCWWWTGIRSRVTSCRPTTSICRESPG